MKYYLGIDGGGTKSSISCANEDGALIFTCRAAAMNGNGITDEQLQTNLHSIIGTIKEQSKERADNCIALSIGAAGIINERLRKALSDAFNKAGYENVSLYGDHETAFAAAFPENHGIILISGTGSLCYGMDIVGNSFRAGGYGHLIDDKGSAYSISIKILEKIVQAEDGREMPTILKDLVFQQLGISDVSQIVNYIYSSGRTKGEIASLAPLLTVALKEGDGAAAEILKETVTELKKLVLAVKKSIPNEKRLALWGSVLLKNSCIRDALTDSFDNTDIFVPKEDASMGALRLAMSRGKR